VGNCAPGAVRVGIAPEQVELIANDGGQCADRSAAAPSRLPEECTLGFDRHAGGPIVDGRGHRSHPIVVRSDLDSDRTLAWCRRHDLGLESLRNSVAKPHSVESGAGEHQGVGLTGIEPPEPRVDIAVEWVDVEVRPSREQEARPPRAVSADATT
jgi:hypothetical protein